MDNGHSHPVSPPVATIDCHGSTQGHPPTLSGLAPETSSLSCNALSSRQQQLLHGRNARFAAKKLSITGLSNRLTQLIHANTEVEGKAEKNQENRLSKSRSTGSIKERFSNSQSSAVLGEISNSRRHRSLRKHRGIPIYQDNQRRPLLDQSPIESPVAFREISSEIQSPIASFHIPSDFDEMRLQEISGNVCKSPLPSTLKGRRKNQQSSLLQKFDTDEYIEHIEKELQKARNDAYSPHSQRPLKEKLRAAIYENERLHKELTEERDRFDTELKRTVEHNAAAEFELYRKVRDLQSLIDEKDVVILELQYQHEDKHLDSNVIETLKSKIDRLEQEKQDLEDENLNVTKRNDILTQLLAMSPTKPQVAQNTSPQREKRRGRPLSLALPRAPSSPSTKFISCAGSTATSPVIEPLSCVSSPNSPHASETERRLRLPVRYNQSILKSNRPSQSEASELAWSSSKYHSRQGTLQSDSFEDSVCDSSILTSPTGEGKTGYKKRPRRFVRGSKQLKPLLLPSLNSDLGVPSSPPPVFRRVYEMESPTSFEVDTSSSVVRHSVSQVQLGIHSELEAKETGFEIACNVPWDGPGPMIFEQRERPSWYEPSAPKQPNEVCSPDIFPLRCDFTDVLAINSSNSSPTPDSDRRLVVSDELSPPNYFDFVDSSSPEPDLPYQVTDDTRKSATLIPRRCFSSARGAEETSSPLEHHLLKHSDHDYSYVYKSRKRRELSSSIDSHCNSPTPKMRCRRSEDVTSQAIGAQSTTSPVKKDGVKNPVIHIRSDRAIQRLGTMRSPANLLYSRMFDVGSIASLRVRTLYTFLSKCTSYIRKLKEDPFSLAKTVLANAWRKNWTVLGNMSWWVLGLFADLNHPHTRRSSIDWTKYDAEDIADRACDTEGEKACVEYSSPSPEAITQPEKSSSNPDKSSWIQMMPGTESKSAQKARWGSSILLWGKFSLVLMLAVGGAVVHGPAEMLKDVEKLKRRSLQGQQSVRRSTACPKDPQGQAQCSCLSTPSTKGTVPRPTSIGLSLAQAQSPMFTFRSGMQIPLLDNAEENDRIGKTLRPRRGRRSLVANLFTQQDGDPPPEPSLFAGLGQSRDEHSARETSNEYGFLQWPSTPDSLHRRAS